MIKYWVNADDFGISKSSTNAILASFKNGLITTTTACANGAYFEEAISLIKNTEYASKVGIHINLTEGVPLTQTIKTFKRFCDQSGRFNGFKDRYSRLTKSEKAAIEEEISAQFEKYLSMGLIIEHIDSHHHIHNSFRVLPIVIKVSKRYKISRIRICRNIGDISLTKRIYKHITNLFLSKYKYTEYMCGVDDLNNNKKLKGTVEIMVHPDLDSNGVLIDRMNDDYNNPKGFALEAKYKKHLILENII